MLLANGTADGTVWKTKREDGSPKGVAQGPPEAARAGLDPRLTDQGWWLMSPGWLPTGGSWTPQSARGWRWRTPQRQKGRLKRDSTRR